MKWYYIIKDVAGHTHVNSRTIKSKEYETHNKGCYREQEVITQAKFYILMHNLDSKGYTIKPYQR